MPSARLPATASSAATETAAAETAAASVSAPAASAPAASATSAKDEGWKPIVVVFSATTLLSGRWLYYAHLLKDAANYQRRGPTKKYQKQENDDQPVFQARPLGLVRPLNAGVPGCKLVKHGLGCLKHRKVYVAHFHVLDDASPGYVITLNICQIGLKAFPGRDEIPAIVNGYDDYQATPLFACTHAVLVSQIFGQPETILVLHIAHHDKNRLYATFQMQPLEIEV